MATKKKSIHAAQRDTQRVKALRGAFIEALQEEEFTRLKFVDETGINLSYARRYGRALGGQASIKAYPCTAVLR